MSLILKEALEFYAKGKNFETIKMAKMPHIGEASTYNGPFTTEEHLYIKDRGEKAIEALKQDSQDNRLGKALDLLQEAVKYAEFVEDDRKQNITSRIDEAIDILRKYWVGVE